MQNTDPTPIIGVFRDQARAEHALEELKQAEFTQDQVTSKVVSLHASPDEQTPENTRTIITVKAGDRDKQAFGILFSNGANNSDLPPGMSLEGTTDLIPKPELEGSFSNDSFFGEEKDLGASDQLGQMDKL